MVLFFTGTGNSRYIARKIAEITGDGIISIGERIKAGDSSPVKSKMPLVFVGPVYAGRFPRIMDEYIRQVEFTTSSSAYFVAACAATPYIAETYAEKICGEKTLLFKGFNSIVMPQGYIAMGGTQSKEVNDKILAEAEPKIIKTAELIRDGRPLPKEPMGSAVMSKILNPIMYSIMISAKGFAYTDKCSGCGKCAKLCPLNNIKLKDGKPVWGKNCTHCMACIAGCPQEAVEYGKKTIGKLRYYLD